MMPLDLAALKDELENCFADPPATAADCAQAWADAIESWCSSIVPASTTVTAAAGALATSLTTAFAGTDAAAAMETAFAAFAAAVGGGMAGYTATAPPGPVGFATQFDTKPETHADAAEQIGDLIHDWMTTGSSALVAPPNTVVSWN